MPVLWVPKDPGETKDYDLDWSLNLVGDSIQSSTWSTPSGVALVLNSSSFTTTLTKVWLSGGIVGQTYVLINTIVTALGETFVESAVLPVLAK